VQPVGVVPPPPAAAGGEDTELPQRVAVSGRPGGAVHADVAAGPGHGQVLGAARAGRGGVDRGPVGPVRRRLDLERGSVGRLPVQGDAADGLGRAEVDFQPLRVGEGAGPSGAGVAVHRVGGRVGAAFGGRGGGRLVQRRVGGPAAGAGAATAAGAVHTELPQRVAVASGPGRAVHADVAPGPGHAQRLGAAGAGRGGVDRGPVGPVGGGLDLERGRVRRLPVQRDLADRLAGTEVDFQPLRVGERARPAGPGVTVDRVGGGVGAALGRGRGGGPVQREVGGPAGSGRGPGRAAGDPGRGRGQHQRGQQRGGGQRNDRPEQAFEQAGTRWGMAD